MINNQSDYKYVETLDSLGRIHTTRRLSSAKLYRNYSEAEDDGKRINIIIKIKHVSNCDEIFTLPKIR